MILIFPAVYEVRRTNHSPLLNSLAHKTQIAKPDPSWGASRVAKFRISTNAKKPLMPAETGRIRPQDVLKIIREHTADDLVMTTDVGSHKIFTALNWPAQTPNRYFVSNGLSAMGFGIPAAIAATKLSQQPTICITGDAGFAMVVGELSLAVEMKLPVIIVLMNDNALDLIRTAQKRRGKTVYGTTFTNPNYRLIAAGFGLHYHHVDDLPSCSTAIKSALQANAPTLIDVQIDPTTYPTAENK